MRNKGFTLIEMAISIVIVGLLSVSAMSLYKPTQQYSNKIATQAMLVRVSNAIVNFAINNHRLPCPDTNADGYQDCAAGVETGGVPFNTLLFELGSSIANAGSGQLNMVYGVYRHATQAADLTQLVERTGDIAGMDNFENKNDFVQALRNAQLNATSAVYPFITGDNAQSGNENCAANMIANPAFILASAGGEDRSGNGNAFDGVNENLAQDGTGASCFAAVSKSEDAIYDDGVITVGFNTLLAHIIN